MKLKYVVFIGMCIMSMRSFGLGVEVGPIGVGVGSHGIGVGVDDPNCVRCHYAECPEECYYDENKGVFLGISGEGGRHYRGYQGDRYQSQRERR